MATTIATVTPEVLALSADFMEELNLQPGAEITVTVAAQRPRAPRKRLSASSKRHAACSRTLAVEWLKS